MGKIQFVVPEYKARKENYLNKVAPYINKNLVKVVLGQRRVGKSYFLFELMDLIRKKNPRAPIIYINKELSDYDFIETHTDLTKYLNSQIKRKSRHYIFIDEIQEIKDFEKSIRSFQAKGEHDIYITGSNAFLLAGELSTYLSGRYIEITIHTLSYAEFLHFHDLKESKETFLNYLRYGGLPFLINLDLKDEIIFDYLKSIYASILFKDVVARHAVRSVALLENLIKLIADSTGSLVSAKSISDFLKSQRLSVSPNVILNYLGFLEQAFFLNKVKRMEVVGRKQLEIGQKYFFEDLGLRNSLVGFRQTDLGKMMENVVYLHLKIMGYTVFVGKQAGKEIDFIAEKNNEKIYIQVAYQINDAKTREREFGNLLSIKDNYPKYVVSFDEAAEGNISGIKHLHVMDCILGRW